MQIRKVDSKCSLWLVRYCLFKAFILIAVRLKSILLKFFGEASSVLEQFLEQQALEYLIGKKLTSKSFAFLQAS